jgi:hypothetical protein
MISGITVICIVVSWTSTTMTFTVDEDVDMTQAPYPHVDRCRPKLSNAYWSSYAECRRLPAYTNLTTLRTYKVDDIMLSILTHQSLATLGVLGLSCL